MQYCNTAILLFEKVLQYCKNPKKVLQYCNAILQYCNTESLILSTFHILYDMHGNCIFILLMVRCQNSIVCSVVFWSNGICNTSEKLLIFQFRKYIQFHGSMEKIWLKFNLEQCDSVTDQTTLSPQYNRFCL